MRWPRMISFAELMTAMSGRDISSSVRPSALRRLRWGHQMKSHSHGR